MATVIERKGVKAEVEQRLWTVDEIALRWHRSTRYVQDQFKSRDDVMKQGELRVRLLIPQHVLDAVEKEQKERKIA